GSGRLVTRLDTPPSSHRHHPDSAIALGNKEAPREIDDLAMVYIKEVLKDYGAALYHAQNNFGRNPTYSNELPLEVAKTIVARHEQATDLSCIMHGDDRTRGRVQLNRFGLDDERAEMYREYIANFRGY
ncbi:hypothetical protein, partial [Bradyrhizobium diazoefficiens]